MGWERPEDWEEQEQYEADADLRGRLFFMRLLVVVVLGGLLGRVIFLQQTRGASLELQAADNRTAVLTSDAPRGVIFDRNGLPLAENLPQFNVAVTLDKLPDDENERQAVFERLSLLTGVPITNTVQQEALVISADPDSIAETERLAELFGASADETLDLSGVVTELPTSIMNVVETFSFDPFNPQVITSSIPITLARIIEQESVFMPGVSVEVEPVRNYPSGESTAHIIGFMGPIPDLSYVDVLGYERDDRVGLFGLEASMEQELSGEKGRRTIEVNSVQREVRQIGLTEPPVPGYNIHLSLDLELQETAARILESYMVRRRLEPSTRTGFPVDLEIEQGSVVAMNPKTGEILALVSLPSYDNNRFATEIPVEYYQQLARNDYRPLLNNAIAGQYPPGSVFKIVTAAAALQEGIVSPSRRLDAPGAISIANQFAPNDIGRAQQFVCWIWQSIVTNPETGARERGSHGPTNIYDALAKSCDIYFYKVNGGFQAHDGREVVDALGNQRLKRYANEFGLGRIQGIELPAEAPGNMPDEDWKQRTYAEPWSTGDDYNTAIGQGYLLSTPLQIANMTAVIANGGFLYRPSIIHHLTDDEGNIVIQREGEPTVFASPGEDGIPILKDESGNLIDPSTVNVNVQFDEDGNYVRPPDLLNTVNVDQQYLDVVAEGMRQVNLAGGTGSGWPALFESRTNADGEIERVYWLDTWGIATAGKSGTAEFCDNIAIKRDWCATDGGIQPSHAWFTAYAPFDDPEIVVAAFMYNAEEGSQWAGPVVIDTMKAYFGVGTFETLTP